MPLGNDHTRDDRKRELPAHLVRPARAEAKASGRPFGEVADRLLDELREREKLDEIRAYAGANTKSNPAPILDAGRPYTPPAGPRDAAVLRERGITAQTVYLASGDSRDLSQLILKCPAWGRWAHWAWMNPAAALKRLPKGVRSLLLKCATAAGGYGEWGRGLVALAYLVFRIAERTKRSGMQVLAGCSAGLLASCIPSADGRRRTLAKGTLTARRHVGAEGVPGTEGPRGGLAGDCMKHECGYVEALRQLGVVVAWQPPADAVPRWQVGPRGYACLQFLLLDSVWCVDAASDPPPA